MKTKIYLLPLLLIFVVACRPDRQSDTNLEQSHNRALRHLIAPGMGTIGIIKDGAVDVYYNDSQGEWVLDERSRFMIPEKNQGLLAMGMGTIGVVQNGSIYFYRLGPDDQWEAINTYTFELPERYDRLVAMKMPWEMGVVGIENDGILEFYYHDSSRWHRDTTANFKIPPGIDGYYLMGDMTIVITDKNKLGLYYLGPEDGWDFMDYDEFVLLLPEEFEGILPLDHRQIAVLHNGRLRFFFLDINNDRWVALRDLDFMMPY